MSEVIRSSSNIIWFCSIIDPISRHSAIRHTNVLFLLNDRIILVYYRASCAVYGLNMLSVWSIASRIYRQTPTIPKATIANFMVEKLGVHSDGVIFTITKCLVESSLEKRLICSFKTKTNSELASNLSVCRMTSFLKTEIKNTSLKKNMSHTEFSSI